VVAERDKRKAVTPGQGSEATAARRSNIGHKKSAWGAFPQGLYKISFH